MFGFISLEFWLYFIYFLISASVAFFIPGDILIKKTGVKGLSRITLSIILGISMWSLQGYILGYLNIRNLSYAYLLITFLIWIKENKHSIKIKNLKIPNFDIASLAILLILILGTITQLISILPNATSIKSGLYFCCGVPDTLYHAALTNNIINNFPPMEPGISNLFLKNYHYLSSLVPADLIRVFHLPFINSEFHYFPIFITVMFGLSVLTFAKLLNINKIYPVFLLFFIYFSGDILFLLTLITNHKLDFTFTTLENPMSLWVSPPRYYAITLLFGSLGALVIWAKNKSILNGLIVATLIGVLIGFKAYIGIFALIGLMVLIIYSIFKRDVKSTIPFIFSLFISALIYFPINSGAGGLIFSSFWRFQDFIAQPNIGLTSLEQARRIYLEGGNLVKAYLYNFMFAFIYILFSTGTLLIAFLNPKKYIAKIPIEVNLFLLSGLFVTSILGFFFLQKTGGANTSQFLISIYIVGSIYASLVTFRLFQSKSKLALLILVLILVLTIPRVSYSVFNHLAKLKVQNGLILSKDFQDSLNFISKTDNNSVILVDPSIGSNCIFVNFIALRQNYLCEAASIEDHGLKLDDRRKLSAKILSSNNNATIKKDLKEAGIDYILKVNDGSKSKLFNVKYQNSEYVILKLEQSNL